MNETAPTTVPYADVIAACEHAQADNLRLRAEVAGFEERLAGLLRRVEYLEAHNRRLRAAVNG